MFTTSKVKWFGSILLAAILLILALTGSKWGTTYAASASINATPIIQDIFPEIVTVGSPDITMVINGLYFGTLADTKVWLYERGVPQELDPVSVNANQITVTIPANLLDAPHIYLVQVVVYVSDTVPVGNYSNLVPFSIWSPDTYLPIMHKLSR